MKILRLAGVSQIQTEGMQLSNFLTVNIETQDENNKVTVLCNLSEHGAALHISETARKILKDNPKLFVDISNTSKLLGGSVFRETTWKKSSSNNSLYTNTNYSIEYTEEKIMDLNFANDTLQRKVRARTKRNTEFFYNPEEIEQSIDAGFFDKNNPKISNILDSSILTEVLSYKIFDEVKSFIIHDYLDKTQNVIDISYRVEIKIETFFDDMLMYMAENLNKYSIFLNKYENIIMAPKNYDAIYDRWNENFKSKTLNQLGLNEDKLNFSSEIVKNSDFGQTALFLYNAELLMDEKASSQIYNKFLEKILPTEMSSPDSISSAISQFNGVINKLHEKYAHILYKPGSDKIKISNFSKKRQVNTIVSKNYEPYTLVVEQIGYNVFDDNSSEEMTTSDYSSRVDFERKTFYPDLTSKNSFLTNFEMKKFESTRKASSYLTPTELVYGAETLKTSRGVANMDPVAVKAFRISKAAIASTRQATAGTGKVVNAPMSTLMNGFDFEITSIRDRLVERPLEGNIDPYIESKHYVGVDSLFVGPNEYIDFEMSKNLKKKIGDRNFDIISQVIPNIFLKNKNAVKSIKDLQLSSANSVARKVVDKSIVDLENIPPQIRYMMTDHFQPNKEVDPIQNNDAGQVIQETQANVFAMRATVGFQRDAAGIVNLNSPIVVDMDEALNSNTQSFVLKAHDYEESNLGMYKDNMLSTIYNNFKIVRRG